MRHCFNSSVLNQQSPIFPRPKRALLNHSHNLSLGAALSSTTLASKSVFQVFLSSVFFRLLTLCKRRLPYEAKMSVASKPRGFNSLAEIKAPMPQGQKPSVVIGSHKLRGAFTDSRKRSKYRQVKADEIYRDSLVNIIASQYVKRQTDDKAHIELDRFMEGAGKERTIVESSSAYRISRAPVKYYLNEIHHRKAPPKSRPGRPLTVGGWNSAKKLRVSDKPTPDRKMFTTVSRQSTRAPSSSYWTSPYQVRKLESAGIYRSYTSTPPTSTQAFFEQVNKGVEEDAGLIQSLTRSRQSLCWRSYRHSKEISANLLGEKLCRATEKRVLGAEDMPLACKLTQSLRRSASTQLEKADMKVLGMTQGL